MYAERRHDLLTPGRDKSYQHQSIKGGPGFGSRHDGIPPWDDGDQRKNCAKDGQRWPSSPVEEKTEARAGQGDGSRQPHQAKELSDWAAQRDTLGEQPGLV